MLNYQNLILADLVKLPIGFTSIEKKPNTIALDYSRKYCRHFLGINYSQTESLPRRWECLSTAIVLMLLGFVNLADSHLRLLQDDRQQFVNLRD